MRVHELLKKSLVKKTVAVPMAQIGHVIKCVKFATETNLGDFILIGDPAKIKELARMHECDLSKGIIIEEEYDEVAACHRAAHLVQNDEAQVLMKGLTQTTTFLRALLDKKYKLLSDRGLISVVAVFEIPNYHKVLFLTDPGINISPNLIQKVEISTTGNSPGLSGLGKTCRL